MRRALLILCCLLPLCGCHHRAKQVFALPPSPPEIAPVMVSVPPPTHPTEPLPAPIKPVVTIAPPPEKPVKKRARTRRSVTVATTTPPPTVATPPAPQTPAQATAAAAPPPISLGQLSAGGETSSDLRQQTIDLIHSQTQRVTGLQSSFVNDHKADVEQTRLYIRQAQESWNASDVEAAHTLATKAKVLLDDLLK